MPLNYNELKTQLIALLAAGHLLTVRWDCGGDDHFVTTLLDDVVQEFDYGPKFREWQDSQWLSGSYAADSHDFLGQITNLSVLLNDYLSGLLGLPSVGEFSMHGTGRIFQEGEAIVIEYQSEAVNWYYELDPDENWPDEHYLTAEEIVELERPPNKAYEEVHLPKPDPQMSADYSGCTILFHLN